MLAARAVPLLEIAAADQPAAECRRERSDAGKPKPNGDSAGAPANSHLVRLRS